MGWKQQLGNTIQEGRKKAGMSLRDLCDLIDVSPETIRQYELGNRVPDADKLGRIAVLLGISELELGDIKISISQLNKQPSFFQSPEQFRLDFEREYTSSKATLRIRPGSFSITLAGFRANGSKR